MDKRLAGLLGAAAALATVGSANATGAPPQLLRQPLRQRYLGRALAGTASRRARQILGATDLGAGLPAQPDISIQVLPAGKPELN